MNAYIPFDKRNQRCGGRANSFTAGFPLDFWLDDELNNCPSADKTLWTWARNARRQSQCETILTLNTPTPICAMREMTQCHRHWALLDSWDSCDLTWTGLRIFCERPICTTVSAILLNGCDYIRRSTRIQAGFLNWTRKAKEFSNDRADGIGPPEYCRRWNNVDISSVADDTPTRD